MSVFRIMSSKKKKTKLLQKSKSGENRSGRNASRAGMKMLEKSK